MIQCIHIRNSFLFNKALLQAGKIRKKPRHLTPHFPFYLILQFGQIPIARTPPITQYYNHWEAEVPPFIFKLPLIQHYCIHQHTLMLNASYVTLHPDTRPGPGFKPSTLEVCGNGTTHCTTRGRIINPSISNSKLFMNSKISDLY